MVRNAVTNLGRGWLDDNNDNAAIERSSTTFFGSSLEAAVASVEYFISLPLLVSLDDDGVEVSIEGGTSDTISIIPPSSLVSTLPLLFRRADGSLGVELSKELDSCKHRSTNQSIECAPPIDVEPQNT
jgi:hypothetical protein